MTAKQFFSKCLGSWESSRLYLYPSSGKVVKTETFFTWTHDKNKDVYTVNWTNATFPNGSMNIRLRGDFFLDRDRGYFTGEETTSSVIAVSNKSLHTLTTYDGVTYDEYIEFLTDDTRFRRTIGYKIDTEGNKTGKVTLVGTYVEKKICVEEEEEEVGVYYPMEER